MCSLTATGTSWRTRDNLAVFRGRKQRLGYGPWSVAGRIGRVARSDGKAGLHTAFARNIRVAGVWEKAFSSYSSLNYGAAVRLRYNWNAHSVLVFLVCFRADPKYICKLVEANLNSIFLGVKTQNSWKARSYASGDYLESWWPIMALRSAVLHWVLQQKGTRQLGLPAGYLHLQLELGNQADLSKPLDSGVP